MSRIFPYHFRVIGGVFARHGIYNVLADHEAFLLCAICIKEVLLPEFLDPYVVQSCAAGEIFRADHK